MRNTEYSRGRLCLLVILFAFIVPSLHANAQVLSAMRNKVPGAYNFWLYSPVDNINSRHEVKKEDTAEDGKLPLIVFLHGRSLSGTDLSKVRKYGPLHALSLGRKIDALIVAPQTSNGWDSGKVDKVVDWVTEEYPVDTNRIYVIGMSMGCYGTIDYVTTHPDKVAASMAICGGGDLKDYAPLRKVPLWILHGTADTAVPIAESEKVIDGMHLDDAEESENRLIFTKLDGLNHSQPGKILYMKETYEWLFKHSLADPGRPVDRSFTIDSSTMKNAYTGLRTGQTYFKVVDK